jgi:peptide/nickel transport system substrate-binding protein
MAQKSGGTLRVYNSSNPPSLSIHEESTIATLMPISAIYNNLVMYDQMKPKNGFDTIVPDLAESWKLDENRLKLTFKLRQGVTWHDDKPFTAKDVVCTYNRAGMKEEYFRRSPRKIWYENIKEIVANGDHEVSFILEKPQPSLLAMLASGLAPVIPCHLTAKDLRTNPVGTGPFKFVEYRSNDGIKLVKNPNYWKKGMPYLDGIDWRIVPSRSTRVLAFVAGEFDITFVGDITTPLMGDIEKQAPKAQCSHVATNVPTNVLVNRERPPFDNLEVRRALALGLDRPSFIEIVGSGKLDMAATMMAPPGGAWGMPPEVLEKQPGYGKDIAGQQAEARKLMEAAGYGPVKKLKIKVSTRDFAAYRDAAVILVDQLNKINFDTELEVIESTVWYNRLLKMDYTVALNLSGVGIDDPDVVLKASYACKSEANYTKYCNPEIEKMLEAQSQEADIEKRRKMVWEIESKLIADVARPIIYHGRSATCWHPHLKGHVLHENSIYNNWRFEQVWLDK